MEKYLRIYKSSVFAKAAIFAFGYGIFFYLLQFFFAKTGMLPNYPTAENIHNSDVAFYDSIAHRGYDASSDNTGFYILFPLIWRLSKLDIWGIIVVNVGFFSLGFGLLMSIIRQSDKQFWILCLTLPAVYFALIPYTESLFFFLGAWLFYAIEKEKTRQIWAALILISLVRATAFFLLPSFLVAQVLSNPSNEIWKSFKTYLLRYALPITIGLAIFVIWQFIETGIWWAYVKKQSTVWGHVFSWPEVHFSNIENADWRHHWLSALAMFVNTVATILLLRIAFFWLKNGQRTENPNLILSLGYLSMVLMSLLFLNPKYGGNHTNVMGANRYTFASPFLIYTLNYFYNLKYSSKTILTVFLGLGAFLALFRAYFSLNQFILVGIIPIILVLAFLLSRKSEKYKWLVFCVVAFNVFVQLHHFQQFISGLYMD
jgi:hypothetical protein